MLAFASAGSSIFTDVVAVNWDHALNSRTPPSLLPLYCCSPPLRRRHTKPGKRELEKQNEDKDQSERAG